MYKSTCLQGVVNHNTYDNYFKQAFQKAIDGLKYYSSGSWGVEDGLERLTFLQT